MNEWVQLIIFAIIIAFVIYICALAFLFGIFVPFMKKHNIKKHKQYIIQEMKKIDNVFPQDKALRDQNIREDREEMIIKSGLKPYEVEYYQKKQEENKNGNTSKRIIETEISTEENTATSIKEAGSRRRGWFGRIIDRRNARRATRNTERRTINSGTDTGELSPADREFERQQWLSSIPNNIESAANSNNTNNNQRDVNQVRKVIRKQRPRIFG